MTLIRLVRLFLETWTGWACHALRLNTGASSTSSSRLASTNSFARDCLDAGGPNSNRADGQAPAKVNQYDLRNGPIDWPLRRKFPKLWWLRC